MKQKVKQIVQWTFIAGMFCWVLVSTVRAGNWGLFWWNVGALIFALLIGSVAPLFASGNRRLILKNMTTQEKASLSDIGRETGKRLGIRVAPFAFLIPFLGILFGVSSLVYTLPPAIALLIILCLPVWRTAMEQTNATFLATAFARANEIKTLKRNSQPTDGQVFSESASSASSEKPSS